jgi:hypothetical protein
LRQKTNMNSIKDLTPQQLRLAADIQERILALQNQLDQLLDTGGQAQESRGPGRRRLSAEGLANIRAGARKRWAKVRTHNGAARPTKRHKMSAAGRARIAAQLRARWAAAKRAGRNAL